MLRLYLPPLVLAGFALAAFTGCGDANYAPVVGTVSLDGQPLPRGMVQFVPVGEHPTSTAEIAADGKYRLQSAEGKDGAFVGKHKVRIDARELPKNEMDTYPKSLIPDRYNDDATSKLEVDVVAGKTNTIDLKLTTTP